MCDVEPKEKKVRTCITILLTSLATQTNVTTMLYQTKPTLMPLNKKRGIQMLTPLGANSSGNGTGVGSSGGIFGQKRDVKAKRVRDTKDNVKGMLYR